MTSTDKPAAMGSNMRGLCVTCGRQAQFCECKADKPAAQPMPLPWHRTDMPDASGDVDILARDSGGLPVVIAAAVHYADADAIVAAANAAPALLAENARLREALERIGNDLQAWNSMGGARQATWAGKRAETIRAALAEWRAEG